MRDVAVIENQLPPHGLLPARRRTRGRVTIGYVAAEEHITEARELRLAEILRGLLDANPRVHLVTVGLRLDLEHPHYTYRQLVPIERLIDTISDFDVGIAPLVDTPFNRARSNVKLKEYAAAGAAWLASPVGPYVGMGEAQGGLLVEDGEWRRVLEELAGDSARREQLARRASAWARRQTIVQTGRVWEEAFRGAIARARAERGDGVRPSSAPPAARARPSV